MGYHFPTLPRIIFKPHDRLPTTTNPLSYTMTRTERSQSLRALAKDRSGSRNGMDMSVPKGGAGAYNWGSIDSEFRYEDDALLDEAADLEDQAKENGCEPLLFFLLISCHILLAAPDPTSKKPAAVRRTSNVTDQDRENAIKVRKNALKSDGGMFFSRRYSTIYIVLTIHTVIDLAAIARSSVAVSCSPPKEGTIV